VCGVVQLTVLLCRLSLCSGCSPYQHPLSYTAARLTVVVYFVQAQVLQQANLAVVKTSGAASPLPVAAAAAQAEPAAYSELAQKQQLGEQLYKLVAQYQPEFAGRITGMLLEMEIGALVEILQSQHALVYKIHEAMTLLAEARAAAAARVVLPIFGSIREFTLPGNAMLSSGSVPALPAATEAAAGPAQQPQVLLPAASFLSGVAGGVMTTQLDAPSAEPHGALMERSNQANSLSLAVSLEQSGRSQVGCLAGVFIA
jgi:Poly-adenylate binding protein, unique domain